MIEPPNLLEGGSHLWNGRWAPRFRVPWDAEDGTLIPITISISDVMHPAPFVCHFQLRADPEVLEDPPSGPPGRSTQRPSPNGRTSRVVLAAPNYREIRKAEWENLVVTPLGGDRKVSSQQIFKGPEMIGES